MCLRIVVTAVVCALTVLNVWPAGRGRAAAAEVRGHLWNDRNANGVCDTGEAGLAGWAVYLCPKDSSAAEYVTTVEPDTFAYGSLLNTVSPYVTLTSLSGPNSDVRNYADPGGQNLVFAPEGGPGWTDTLQLRMDFAWPAASISVDALPSYSPGGTAQLQIYDAGNNLIETATTSALASGQRVTLSLSLSAPRIAYAVASATGSAQPVLFDRLVFTAPRCPLAIADGSGLYSLTGVPAGKWSLSLLPPSSWRQTHPTGSNPLNQLQEAWAVRYNGPAGGDDLPSWAFSTPNTARKCMAIDAAGNVHITGMSWNGTDYDFVTLKYAAAGTLLWEARFADPGGANDMPAALAVDSAGSVCVTGSSDLPTGRACVTVKYNAAGQQQWVNTYQAAGGYAAPAAIGVDTAGNVYVAGQGYYSASSESLRIKYDSSGAEQWANHDAGPEGLGAYASDMAVDAAGNSSVVANVTSSVNSDCVTTRYDSSGAIQWQATYNGPANDHDFPNAVVLDAAGNVYVAGRTICGMDDFFTVKYSATGTQAWADTYNGPGSSGDEACALAVDPAGNVYVTGRSYRSGTGNNWATIQYDPAGVRRWIAQYDGSAHDEDVPSCLAVDGSGNVYVTGFCTSYVLSYRRDLRVVRYNADGVVQCATGYSAAGDESTGCAIGIGPAGEIYVAGAHREAGYSDILLLRYTGAAAAPSELLANGSFETTSPMFAGWSTYSPPSVYREWTVSGAGDGGGALDPTSPQDGTWVAWHCFDSPSASAFSLWQDVTIPSGASATLRWMERVQWEFGPAATLPRTCEVQILEPATGQLIWTPYSFATGTYTTSPAGDTGWQSQQVDLSALAGSAIRLQFAQTIPQALTGPGQFEIDAVSLAALANRSVYTVTIQEGQSLENLDFAATATISDPPGQPDLLPQSDSGIADDDDLTNLDNGTAGKTLQFQVSGTWAGAVVTIYADGVAIGSQVATGDVTIVTTNGSADLADGTRSITARQVESGKQESSDSQVLSVTVDTILPSGPGGTLDATFGAAGQVTTLLGQAGEIRGVAIQPDDKIVIVGDTLGPAPSRAVFLARYNPDGVLDSTFGTGGVAIAELSPLNDFGQVVAVQPDGKILVAGWRTSTNLQMFVARFNSAGGKDTTFGSSGLYVSNGTTTGSTAKAFCMSLLPDGRILVGGAAGEPSRHMAVWCLQSNGQVYSSFGSSGLRIVPLGATSCAYGVAVQSDGKIVLAGDTTSSGSTDVAVARLSAGGGIDPSFTPGGGRILSLCTGNDTATAVAVQPDGKIVLGGAAGTRFAAARLAADGNPDVTFDGDGIAILDIDGCPGAQAMLPQSDNRIVLAGAVSTGGHTCFALTRLLSDGQIDPAFGIATTPFGQADAYIRALALQADGKIIAAGYSTGTPDNNVAVSRYGGGSLMQPDLLPASDSGVSQTDNITSLTTLTFALASSDTYLRFYADGALASNAYQMPGALTLAGQAEGTHAYSLVAVDAAGNESGASAALQVTVDVTAPQITATLINGSAGPYTTVLDLGLVFSEAVSIDPAGLRLHNDDLGTFVDLAAAVFSYDPATRTATWDLRAIPLVAGHYTASLPAAAALDLAGNLLSADYTNDLGGVSSTNSLVPGKPDLLAASDTGVAGDDDLTNLDNGAPAKTLQFQVAGTVVGATVTIAADGAIIASREATDAVTVLTTDGSVHLADGVHAITARQTEPGKVQSAPSKSLQVTIDTTPPDGPGGLLDPTFGTGGQVTAAAGTSPAINAVALQPDGKILVAGDIYGTTGRNMLLMRFLADGSVDSAFGAAGQATADVTSGDDYGQAVAVQPDGKIIVAGYCTGSAPSMLLARFLPNGTLDTTFKGTGKLYTRFSYSSAAAYAVAVLPDGRVLAGGVVSRSNNDFAVACFTGTGLVDATFGTSGVAAADLGAVDAARAMLVQSDGCIVLAGERNASGQWDTGFVRFLPNGQPDPSFGSAGSVIVDTGLPGDRALGIAIQPDGKIVSVGSGSSTALVLLRLTAGGALDSTFGAAGKAMPPVGTFGSTYGIAVQPDGRIVAVGSTVPPATARFATVRVLADGGMDPSFDGDGISVLGFGTPSANASGTVIQPDGRIVVAGYTKGTTPGSAALLRYRAGNLAGPDLLAQSDSGASDADNITSATTLEIQAGEGETYARLCEAGTLLSLPYRSGGLFTLTDPLEGVHAYTVVAVDAAGNESVPSAPLQVTVDRTAPHVTATTINGGASQYTTVTEIAVTFNEAVAVDAADLTLYNNDAGEDVDLAEAVFSYDPATNTARWDISAVTLDEGYYTATWAASGTTDIAGNLLASDHVFSFPSSTASRIPGKPDLLAAFDSGVSSEDDLTNLNNGSTSATLQFQVDNTQAGATVTIYADGVAIGTAVATGSPTVLTTDGSTSLADGQHVVTARQVEIGRIESLASQALAMVIDTMPAPQPAGPLDTAFGTGGLVRVTVSESPAARAMVLQPDGKILVAADAGGSGSRDLLLLRFNPDGSADSGFGTAGQVVTDRPGYSLFAQTLAMQADGKVVVGGYLSDGGPALRGLVARYLANGSPDLPFADQGMIQLFLGYGACRVTGLALLPDDKILLAGSADGAAKDMFVGRLTSSGYIDYTFGLSGRLSIDLGGQDECRAMLRQPDGRIVLAGLTGDGTHSDVAVARLMADGQPDPSFGTQGHVIVDLGTNSDRAVAVGLGPDSRLVVACDAGSAFAAIRLNPDGTLDGTFGAGGKAVLSVEAYGGVQALALQPDGRVLLGAGTIDAGHPAFTLVRLLPDGSLDASFDGDGIVVTSFGEADAHVAGLAINSAGRIIAAGLTKHPTTPTLNTIALAAYHSGYVAIPDLLPQSDSGRSDADNITAASDLTFHASATEPFIRVYDDATLVSEAYLPTGTFTLLDQAERTHRYHVTSVDAAGNESPPSLPLVVTVDLTAPQVTAAIINDGAAQRSYISSLAVSFDEPAEVAAGSLTVRDDSRGADVDLSGASFTCDSVTRTARWDTLAVPLENGAYTAILIASAVSDMAGNVLPADYTFSFVVQIADVSGDGHVDVLDLLSVVYAFGTCMGDSGYDPACDFNRDGSVDVVDLLIMVENFGT